MKPTFLRMSAFGIFFFSYQSAFGTDYIENTPPAPMGETSLAEPSNVDFSTAALSGKTVKQALNGRYGDATSLNSRGAVGAALYRAISPSVVIVITDGGLGTGSLIGSDKVLTNWHVIKGYRSAGIVFKPKIEGAAVSADNVVIASVIKFDQLSDLALLQLPSAVTNVAPVALGDESDIEIGADVHAIGHPSGDAWTYTAGIISQYRRNFDWKYEDGSHEASVVQTQTPINPGNSGGPLLAENGKLIGVNSFKATGEGLNFAVSIVDVKKLLGAPLNIQPSASQPCQLTKLYEGRSRDGASSFIQYDTNCDGKADAWVVTPDDATKPILALLDTNYDGKIDVTIEDRDRDGKWDISFHDVDFDGKIDLIGFHSNGKIAASKFETYIALRCNKNDPSYDARYCL